MMESSPPVTKFLIPEGEEIIGEAVVDEMSISRGRDVEPWLSDGKPLISSKNLKVVLTRKALYLVVFGYKGLFRTLAKYQERLEDGLKRNTVEYEGAAMISGDVYKIPLSSIETASISYADGLSRKYRVQVEVEELRPWWKVILGVILLLAGIALSSTTDSLSTLGVGILLSLIGLTIAIMYAGKRIDVEKDVDMARIGEMRQASQTVLKLLVRYTTPRQARRVQGPDGSRLEIVYDVDLYTIALKAYNERSSELRELARKLSATENRSL